MRENGSPTPVPAGRAADGCPPSQRDPHESWRLAAYAVGLWALLGGLAAIGQTDEKPADSVVVYRAIEDQAKRAMRLLHPERVCEIGESAHAGTVAFSPHSFMKFASSAWPCSVAMLSG